MAIGKLGFGMMRLPLIDAKTHQPRPMLFADLMSTEGYSIDHDQVCAMVDKFIANGFTYFDTSYVYLGGRSEPETREALVKRHPRDSFTLATKMPTFALTKQDDVPRFFEEQLNRCGVDYFDYYLIHTLRSTLYDSVAVKFKVFEYLVQQKKLGRIRNLGFSFHDTPELLDRILTEHPETDFVQIPISYFDWNSKFVQARRGYEVIRKHGKKVVIMQPVKGGLLASAPAEAETLMKQYEPDRSIASWAIRFAAGLDGVIAVLSGMSSIAQMDDNTSYMKDFTPLTDEEKSILPKIVEIYKLNGPLHRADYSIYEGIAKNGMPVDAVLEAYNSCLIHPDPSFATDNNYYAPLRYAKGLASGQSWIDAPIIDKDGNDITDLVRKAEKFLIDNNMVGEFR